MLKVHVQKSGGVALVSLRGSVVAGDTNALMTAVQSQSDVSAIVLDFGKVNRIDAGGLGVLLELREQTQANGIGFRLVNVTKLIQQVFEMTCLDSVFEVSSGAEVAAAVTRSRKAVKAETSDEPRISWRLMRNWS